MIEIDNSESIDFALFLNGYVQGALMQFKEQCKQCKKQEEVIDIIFEKLNSQKKLLEDLEFGLQNKKHGKTMIKVEKGDDEK